VNLLWIVPGSLTCLSSVVVHLVVLGSVEVVALVDI